MIPLQSIIKNNKEFPGKIAIKDRDISLDWYDYSNLVKTTIVNLNKIYDLESISRILVISKNRWELMILYSAFATLKIPYTGLDYSATIEQKISCFNSLNPDLIVYSNEFSNDVEKFGTVNLLNIDHSFLKLITGSDISEKSLMNIINSNSNRPFESFSFTSGTSGVPKVVYRNTPFEAIRMKELIEINQFTGDDKFLVTLPFYHVSVAGWTRLFMNLGCTIVFSNFNSAKDIYTKLIDEKITAILIVPPILRQLIQHMERKSKNTSIRFIMVGGKNFPASLKQKTIRYFGNVLNEYYGSTETGINILSNSNIINVNPYSSGIPMKGSDIIILDKDNDILPYNNVGRVAIHSYQNAHSYLNSELNTVLISDKTYIVTGDAGYMDEAGHLFIIYRADTMEGHIGFNLYNVENQIRLIKGVKDVVISLSNNEGVSEIIAYISIEKNICEILKKDIDDMVRCFINQESPLKIKFVDDIPYSLSGKVKFKELEAK